MAAASGHSHSDFTLACNAFSIPPGEASGTGAMFQEDPGAPQRPHFVEKPYACKDQSRELRTKPYHAPLWRRHSRRAGFGSSKWSFPQRFDFSMQCVQHPPWRSFGHRRHVPGRPRCTSATPFRREALRMQGPTNDIPQNTASLQLARTARTEGIFLRCTKSKPLKN